MKMTICVECKHFIPGKQWYFQYCGAIERERAIDPVTGEEGYLINETTLVTSKKYPHARECNDGNCSNFKKAEWSECLKT